MRGVNRRSAAKGKLAEAAVSAVYGNRQFPFEYRRHAVRGDYIETLPGSLRQASAA
jgi:hypothetical protein